MKISVKGAKENNLKNVNIDFESGITVVTGISGSGKTSLIFDTLYHEANRRFLDVFSSRSSNLKGFPAKVDNITGLGPTIAVGQNLLNRNPLSTLATASGIHPFLRLIYATFGERHCSKCDAPLQVLKEDEIIDKLLLLKKKYDLIIFAPMLIDVKGSHRTLLELLIENFKQEDIIVDGKPYRGEKLHPKKKHSVKLKIGIIDKNTSVKKVREILQQVNSLGINAVEVQSDIIKLTLSQESICVVCGNWFGELRALHFHSQCSYCKGSGCNICKETGLHPLAVPVLLNGKNLPNLLIKPVDEVRKLLKNVDLPHTADRVLFEITKRLEALQQVGLGYLSLNRSSPTLSRGESQRVRLAVAISSKLEDMLYVLDEPTIGQHMADVSNFLPIFQKLKGPVIFVEHDRFAAAIAKRAIDIGPDAGTSGGEIVFDGSTEDLWKSSTYTGQYFSMRKKVTLHTKRNSQAEFLTIKEANLRNLKNIDISIPLNRLTVVTGVSGSGKSTFVIDVLVASLLSKEVRGCKKIIGSRIKPVIVDQNPIGRNPRSNPATYTKLSDIIRDIYASKTPLTSSHFSFNRPAGACTMCKGIGAKEVKMKYLPSQWITCSSCGGERFSDEVLKNTVNFNGKRLSIAEFYTLSVSKAYSLIQSDKDIVKKYQQDALRILKAMIDVGLGYLPLGQPSTTLSGGEAQRVKLAKYLGKATLRNSIIILDEPSTGLHPKDIIGLLNVLDCLVAVGATILVVEHNSDIIRAADWVIDLGPKAGDLGGELVFSGSPKELQNDKKSLTGQFLNSEKLIHPSTIASQREYVASSSISIKGARIHNLRNISVNFPKNTLIVVTGVSGSGKSSIVSDILENEARKRFLETLSLYERQGVREGPEVPVDSVTGLGVTISIGPRKRSYNLRSNVNHETGIAHQLAILYANIGEKECSECGTQLERKEEWYCPACGNREAKAKVRHFSSQNYAAACETCNGIGSLRKPRPEKLIVNSEKPICNGAMYSPGFFPFGYICKPLNGGYYILRALAEKYNFDPETTPWNEMSKKAQDAFLFGHPEPLEGISIGRKGRTHHFKQKYPGFYGWIRDWDVGGTYTETEICLTCKGGHLKSQYLAVTLAGYNIHELSDLSIAEIIKILSKIAIPENIPKYSTASLLKIQKRLKFLNQVGLGYINLNRIHGTLSAGEAQRIKLAGLLGSGLTSLTILLDEPSRGLHPSEVSNLLVALKELKDEGNTVIIVEHDPVIIRAAEYIIDVGPGPGVAGGKIVAKGSIEEILQKSTITAKWLQGKRKFDYPTSRRVPNDWMKITGAEENNLKGKEIKLPLGVLVGVCGVSGSGKSTLMIDTIGRALVPKKQTTSVAYEPIKPGKHKEIIGTPKRVVLVDQTRREITNPFTFLGLAKTFYDIFAETEIAQALGLDSKKIAQKCSVCGGRGRTYIKMDFLPSIIETCETCRGSGHTAEIWDIKVKGYSLPEMYQLTIDQLFNLFKDEESISRKLKIVKDVGLGYIVLRQPGYTLSGGESQRLKIAWELNKKKPINALYILDEPTVGLHLEDINLLIQVLNRLVDAGNTVMVIEHCPELLAACDWLVELGPIGGPQGGKIIAEGTPESIAERTTPTSPFIKQILEDSK